MPIFTLYARPASPFVRKVRIIAIETGQIDDIDIIMMASPEEQRERVPGQNPLGKIPVAVLEDGSTLYDSRVVAEYLDSLHDGPKIFPPTGPERWAALSLQALGDGLADAAILLAIENSRQEANRSESWIGNQWRKVTQATDYLENNMAALDGALNVGQIAVACALGYADFRDDVTARQWRDGRPNLARWFEDFAKRPSMEATYFARPS